MRPPIIVDDDIFNDRVGRLILTGGDPERAGLTLEEVGDLVFTRRMKIHPDTGKPSEPKAKGTKKEKLVGVEKMDDLLG